MTPNGNAPMPSATGRTPGVAADTWRRLTLWWLSYPDQALQWSHEALTLARELARTPSAGASASLAA